MDFQWVAIAFGDIVWIAVAFGLGLLARSCGLPPLVGFLATGFLLNGSGITSGETLNKLADLGVTLLLFTVGLKLNLRTLARPQVWAVTGLHTAVVVAVLAGLLMLLALGSVTLGLTMVAELDVWRCLLLAFALSFSSTVFVVKALEDRGELTSLHGRIAVGILVMQDLAAVVFLAISTAKWPSAFALLVLLLIPLRGVLVQILQRVGHGELQVLYGFLLALGGAEAFEWVGLKGDLGALVLGVLIAGHPKAEELSKTMLGFKDLFLLGFFLSIGMSGQLSLQTLTLGALLAPLVVLKSTLFFVLLTRFRLRARTALLATVNLSNYSEFGLIVVAIGVANGWLGADWLIVLAVALSVSFVMAAALNAIVVPLYARNRDFWRRFQTARRMADDRHVDIHEASVAVIGMGGVGTGAYDTMSDVHGADVVGIDFDPVTVANQQRDGRSVILGDPSDADFWDRVHSNHDLELVLLALPKLTTNLAVLRELKTTPFHGSIAVIAKFPDEMTALEAAGADTVYNIYREAGAGFAAHVVMGEHWERRVVSGQNKGSE